jgi:glutamate carboxypeptidase
VDRYASHLEWIEAQAEAAVGLLWEWADENTGTGNVAGLERFAERASAAFADIVGAEGEIVALPAREVVGDDGAVRAAAVGPLVRMHSPEREWEEGVRVRVLLGIHMDTVYGEEAGFQDVSPVDGVTLRGPGVADAPGGLLVMLLALGALERSPFGGGVRWEVLLNSDEEVGSPSSGAYLAEAARRSDVGMWFEPALLDGALAGSRKGSGNWTLVARGRSAHAGRDLARGRNAICAVGELIVGLEELGRKFEGVTVNVGAVHGGGAVNVVPDRALCRVNVRVDTAEQGRAFEAGLKELVERVRRREGITVEVHGGMHAPPKVLDAATMGLLEAIAGCGRELGAAIRWRATGGTCDGNRLAAAGLPTVDSLGVCGGEIHTVREFVHVPSIVERAKLTALLLMKLGSGEIAVAGPAGPGGRKAGSR